MGKDLQRSLAESGRLPGVGSPCSPEDLVRVEAAALLLLADRLETSSAEVFGDVVELLVETVQNQRRVIVTGLGKSGLIARKIASTLCSTGTPAHFLHPTEALHGDLGTLTRGDVVVALSSSGETDELLTLLGALERTRTRIVAICGCLTSTLATCAHLVLDASISEEACPHNLAPTASTAVMLALGDSIAICVSQRLGFQAEDFANLHPGGRLGVRLAKVCNLMHTGEALPRVGPTTALPDLIYEMSRKKLGMTTVVEGSRLVGLISDGDLRRILQRDGAGALDRSAAEIMKLEPITIAPDATAAAALALMEQRKITSLVVVGNNTNVLGVVHIHDLWALQLP